MSRELRQPRVFVVDDEPIIATTMAMILRQHGFEVYAFDVPREAFEAPLIKWHLICSSQM
jgi:DNA-binding response OmpR family regulator